MSSLGRMGAIALAVTLGCSDDSNTSSKPDAGSQNSSKIVIGGLLSITGDLAGGGKSHLEAVTLAVEQINAAGGVLGAQLEIKNNDDATDKAKAVTAATLHADNGVQAVIGSLGSAVSLEIVTKVTAAKKMVQVSGSSTSPLLTTAQDDGYFFRTCPSDALQGKLLAKRAKAKSQKKVAILYIPGAYGLGLANAFEAEFEANGGTVTLSKEYVEGKQSYTDHLTEVFAGEPEAILLVAYPEDGAQIVKDYVTGFSSKSVFWYFTDGIMDKAFVTAAGASTFTFPHEGTGPASPTGPAFDKFKTAFKAKYSKDPSPGSFDVNAYDAVFLIALAMQAAGKNDGALIKAQMKPVSAGGTAYDASQIKEAIAAAKEGKDINYEGASGNVDLDDAGDVVAPYDIWKVKDGALAVTETSVSP